MKNKVLLLTIFLIIQSLNVLGQSSNFKHKRANKSDSKKEEKKTNDIKSKTKNCEVFDGLFKIYQSKKDGKSYLEIDTSHLNKEFIYFSYFENGVTDAGAVKGRYRGSKIIKISKFYNKIDFTINNTKYFFDENSQLSKASLETVSLIITSIQASNRNNVELGHCERR